MSENIEDIYKIIFCGLDNAGKTSIILSLENKKSQISFLKPTPGINRSNHRVLGFPIINFDFGGQASFREQYLKDPSYLENTDLMFFVVDMMDRNRFSVSIDYFKQIIDRLKELNGDKSLPPLILLLHKVDPDNKMNSESYIHSNIEIFKKLYNRNIKMDIQTFETTIYDYSSLMAGFSAGISQILPKTEMMETYFEDFLKKTHSNAISLLDRDGLILFDCSHDEESKKMAQLCGIQFALAAESLEQRYGVPHFSLIEAESEFGWSFFKTIELKEIQFFLSIVSKSRKNFDLIRANLPDFTNGIKETLELILNL